LGLLQASAEEPHSDLVALDLLNAQELVLLGSVPAVGDLLERALSVCSIACLCLRLIGLSVCSSATTNRNGRGREQLQCS
jgi:hypothetical protein